ncbi:hypothetical protein MKX01_041348 [Papaver californicum]|nr:hypothetical protein MKX01_041348 [Papaver californicum]
MRLMTEGMTNQTAAITALIQNHYGNHNAPPPPPGGNANCPNPQGTRAQATWLNLLKNSTDPLVVDKWKEDFDKIFVAMRCTPVQKQQLVVLQLSGETRKWWKNATIWLDENTLTYAQFCERFDARYFPSTVRHKKIKKFVDLEQVQPMLIDDYVDRNISLHRFGKFMNISQLENLKMV